MAGTGKAALFDSLESRVLMAATVARPAYNTGTGFFVSGSKVYDANGQEFVMRGFSQSASWGNTINNWSALAETPKTGANVSRLAMSDFGISYSPASRAMVADRMIAEGIVPVVEDHDTTNRKDVASLNKVVDRWLNPANVAWLKKDEKYVILNIANEWGPVTTVWRDAYVSAIKRIRAAGIKALVMIDAAGYGQDISSIKQWAKTIEAADPQHNVVFSIHMYGFWRTSGAKDVGKWSATTGAPWDIKTELSSVQKSGIPLVVGAKKGFPNFNEFAMWSEFLVSRKLQLTRTATNLPPNSTNLMYTLSISNLFGVELWNSYQAAYPRATTITISNFTYGLLTNQLGLFYTNISSSIVTSNVLAGAWPGRDNKFSFKVPQVLTNTFLTNSSYSFNSNKFVPIGLNQYEVEPNFPVPNWYLTLSNRMTCLISEGTNIVDFVLLNDNLNVDLTSALLSGKDPFGNQTPFGIRGVWETNRPTGGPTAGVLLQLDISSGETFYAVSQQDWREFSAGAPNSENDKTNAMRGFREFLKLPPNLGGSALPPNNSLAMQAGFSPAAKMSVVSVWQANDPLVHYHVDDLRFEPPTTNFFRVNQPATNIAPATLGDLNTRYSPWGGKPNSSAQLANDYDLRVKDSSVMTSDDWHFPSNKLATIV